MSAEPSTSKRHKLSLATKAKISSGINSVLPFEKRIVELEGRLRETESSEEREGLEKELERERETVYPNLSPWERVLLARHIDRPRTMDFVERTFDDFIELHGDRAIGDDTAMVAGIARFQGQTVMVVGQEKGRTTEERGRRNFGMAHPEGYRKALRLMRLAEKFGRAVVTFIDTPGAYPGLGSEERGVAEAIAMNLREMARLRVPILSVVIGEGGSGGALGLGVSDRILMLEYAIYSVISPEGCASILWRDGEPVEDAAEALKLTAQDLHALGIIDRVIPEPLGGAHRDSQGAIAAAGDALEEALGSMVETDGGVLRTQRREKYLEMGKKGLG